MHSELPQKEREKVINVLNSGKCASVLSTSSLELGVDYKNVSFILNVGLDNPVSLIQRIGRGGRGDETLRTVLGIILAKATPTELLKTYDKRYMETLAKLSFEGYSLYVTNENPQVIKRGFLVESIAKLAKKGEKTHASRKSGGPLSKESLATFIEKIVSTLGEQ
jgi:DEAD/DEAH box helicase domain-containing protein